MLKFTILFLLLLLSTLFDAQVQAQNALRLYLKPLFIADGFMEDRFVGPAGIYVDRKAEEIYVADPSRGEIAIFDYKGTPLFKFGREKGLNSPYDLVVRKGIIYVSQSEDDYIGIFSYRGDPMGRLAPPKDIPFKPGRLAIDEEGNIYVINTAGNAGPNLVVFSKGGVFKRIIGKGLKSLSGVAVKEERIYLLTPLDFPVVRVLDKTGQLLNSFAAKGESSKAVGVPLSVEVDAKGRIWLADAIKGFILYDRAGTEITRFNEFEPGKFFFPVDIDFDSQNNVYWIERGGAVLRAFKVVE